MNFGRQQKKRKQSAGEYSPLNEVSAKILFLR